MKTFWKCPDCGVKFGLLARFLFWTGLFDHRCSGMRAIRHRDTIIVTHPNSFYPLQIFLNEPDGLMCRVISQDDVPISKEMDL